MSPPSADPRRSGPDDLEEAIALHLITTTAALRDALSDLRARGSSVGLLATMGALHEGHLANTRLLAAEVDAVVVTIFVNPTQFDRAEDLAAYPRDLDADLEALAALGDAAPALVFAPPVDEVYPRPPVTTVHVAGLSEVLEGAARPGHFDGVATVVTKLLNLVGPDVAVFGRKDLQQLQVVRRLVADLDLGTEVLAAPTVREPDGLALSSRNRRLSPDARAAALAIPAALGAAVDVAAQARTTGRAIDPAAVTEAATSVLSTPPPGAPPLEVDYLAVVDPETLEPPAGAVDADARLAVLVAAWSGGVRLIDNVVLGDLDDEGRLVEAVGDRTIGPAARSGEG